MKKKVRRKQTQSVIQVKLGSLKDYDIRDSKETIRRIYSKKYLSRTN